MKSFSFFLLFLIAGFLSSAQTKSSGSDWQYLFNGKDLSGWKRLAGKAEYTVENAVIVGRTVMNSRNTFLVTEKEYGDFVLELDVWVEDEEGNAGIQTRSHFDPAGHNGDGKVYGRQCEIDPTPRSWTGGIYDEGRRDWLYPMQLNARAQHAYKAGEYNHYKIECIGNTMKTWVNGVAMAYVVDTIDAKGFIGLQVHGIKSNDNAGKKVCFKNIRIKTKNLVPAAFPANVYVANFVPNTLTAYEKKDGWNLLFDGKTNRGWRSAKGSGFPEKGWAIGNGVLAVAGAEGKESTNGGDIVTNAQYAAFDLSFEFKLTPGANSGVKYFVTLSEKSAGSAIGLEYQVLDDTLHPDA
ncbi:MAG: DUF1080 domain-containing protein, partial [Chitinophagaceae bacterium]|nr:DUF1080 domain-containing protein [Chitinophagaceae bacterium]